MSNSLPPCPKCQSSYSYLDADMLACPECGHEWQEDQSIDEALEFIKDAYGTVLSDGDAVSIIKDLKIKGSSAILKVGTKVKNIRIVSGDHPIDCKIDGFGPMKLKPEFVKKI